MGEVVKCHNNATFSVKLENGKVIIAYLRGKMKLKYIKVLPGDKVKIEMSIHDSERGRIIYRY